MNLVTLKTPWNGSGTQQNPYRPKIMDVFPGTWHDITGTQGGMGNDYLIDALIDDATLSSIKSSSQWKKSIVSGSTAVSGTLSL